MESRDCNVRKRDVRDTRRATDAIPVAVRAGYVRNPREFGTSVHSRLPESLRSSAVVTLSGSKNAEKQAENKNFAQLQSSECILRDPEDPNSNYSYGTVGKFGPERHEAARRIYRGGGKRTSAPVTPVIRGRRF